MSNTKTARIYINTSYAEEALEKLQKKADALNKKIEEGRQAGKKMSAAIKDLDKTNAAIQGVQDQIDKGLRPSFKQVSSQVTKLRNELKNMSEDAPGYAEKFKEYEQASSVFSDMKKKIDSVTAAEKNMAQEGGGLTKVGAFFAGVASNLATGLISTLQSAGTAVFNLRSEFEKSAQNLSAITGATGADFDFLKKAAIDLSTTGATSATEYVEAFKLIASAKPELLSAKEDLVSVTKAAKLLADAAGIDLPTAATKLTDALNQFGAPAADAGKYVDALAAASKYGAAEVPEIIDALLQFGAQAKSANIDIYESSAAIELLAEKGVKGADAGTKLRNVFLTLNAVKALPKEAIAELEAAGVKTSILSDKSLSLQQRLQELSKIQDNTTALVKVFGKENFNAGQIVLQNIPRYAELTRQVKEQGVAAQQAATNTDTLSTKWEKFKNVLAARFLGGGNDFFKGLVDSMTKIIEPTKTAAERMTDLGSSIIHLEKDIVPLANRYDELKGKTQLSKDEQAEMKTIVEKITAIIPGAASAWDQYGNKIGISTDKVREMVQQQKNLLKYTNAEALKDVTVDVNAFQTNVDKIRALVAKTQKEIADGKATGKFGATKDIFGSEKYFTYDQRSAKTLESNLRIYNNQLKQASDLLDGAKQKQEELNGDALEKQVKAQAAAAKKAQEDQKKKEAEIDAKNYSTTEPTDKKAENKKEKLIKQYNEFVKGLNGSISELLAPEASKKFVAILNQTAEDMEKLQKLSQSDDQYQKGKLLILEKQRIAIHNLFEEEAKTYQPPTEQTTGVDVSTLPKAVRDVVGKQPATPVKVPVQVLPEIRPEDEKAVGLALSKAIDRLQRNQKAGLQLDVLTAKNPGEKRDALLQQLDDEHALEMSNKELTDNEKLVKEEQYQQARKDIIFKHQQEVVAYLQEGLQFASQAIDILGTFGQAATNRENRALQKELANNEVRKASLKRLENSKVISSQEAQRQIAAIEKEEAAKKEALEKKQFERQKKQQIAQALVNGALAVTNIWATTPKIDFGASTYIMLALSAAATIASVAEIASQKFADGGQVQPEKMQNGKITVTPNIPAQPNGDNVLATVKVGEVILNEEQQKALGGPATFKAIGVPGFATGGTVKPFWKNRPYERVNFPKVSQAQKDIRHFATGGLVRAATATAAAAGQISNSIETQKTEVPATDPALLETLHLLGNTVADLKKRLDDGINASVSLKKLDDARALQNRILKDASMK